MTYNWYINNCQYADNSDVNISVSLDDEDDALHPEYFRITQKYELHERNYSKNIWAIITSSTPIFDPKSEIDYRWCNIRFEIKNIGTTVIEDYKLYLTFDNYDELSCNTNYCFDLFMDKAIQSEINNKIDRERELFFSNKLENQLEFRPKDKILIQEDSKFFTAGIIPSRDIDCIHIQWRFLSRNYQKNGELTIPVKPIFEDKETIIYVDSPEELKPDERIVEPKIVEE